MMETFGGSVASVNQQLIDFMSQIGKNINLSQKGISQLYLTTSLMGDSSPKVTQQISLWASQMQRFTGIPAESIIKDIANASSDVFKYMRGNTAQFANSALYAKKLGLQINKIAETANKMLQFESSITDQMTASLMLGQKFNFNQSRSLFLQGKFIGGLQAMRRQLANIDLDKINVFQASALEQATGYTVKQLRLMKMKAQMQTKYYNNLSAQDKKLYEQYGQDMRVYQGMTNKQWQKQLQMAKGREDMRSGLTRLADA